MYGLQQTTAAQDNNSCLPDSAGKIAAVAFAVMLTAACALTVAILLPKDPSLNSIFYPVFSVAGGFAFLCFILALLSLCKQKTPVSQPQLQQQHSFGYPMAPYPYPQPQQTPAILVLNATPGSSNNLQRASSQRLLLQD